MDFEQQWAPFVDFSLVKDPYHGVEFSFDEMLIAGGLEVITFPFFMRSLYIRISAGFNLKEMAKRKKLPGGNNREFFLVAPVANCCPVLFR